MRPVFRWALVFALVVILIVAIAACGESEREPFRDAPQSDIRNDDPAEIIEMPDGFSNLATKCDNGNRIYVIFKGDANRGSVAVVKDAAGC